MVCWVVLDLDFKHKCNRPGETLQHFSDKRSKAGERFRLLQQQLQGGRATSRTQGRYRYTSWSTSKETNDGERPRAIHVLPGRFMSSYYTYVQAHRRRHIGTRPPPRQTKPPHHTTTPTDATQRWDTSTQLARASGLANRTLSTAASTIRVRGVVGWLLFTT